jgi:nucleoside-diphosphate-sugar epimerase
MVEQASQQKRFPRVLVTGATGFVARAIIRRLASDGHGVLVLVLKLESGRGLEAEGIRVAIGEMPKPETFAPLVAEVDAVIYAAQVRKRRLIYTTGAFSRGDCGDRWVTEETSFSPPSAIAGLVQ